MKRTLVLTILALFGLSAAHAQQQFATLQHGDSIRVFYGDSSYRHALNASVNGDIITLSPGVFIWRNIDKAVTIKGAGMFAYDTITGTTGTVISGDFTIHIPQDSLYHLTMEGIYCPNSVFVSLAYDPHFNKCYLPVVNHTSHPDIGTVRTMINAQFVNCIIGFYSTGRSITAYNCVFVSDINFGCTAYNCILKKATFYSDVPVISLYNCICHPVGNIWTHNCLSYNSSNPSAFSSIFKYYNGSVDYNNPVSFELQDSIAANNLGGDGTQVGIYGGQAPFNPRVLNYSTTVANQSRPDGKLEVTIQPINE